MAGLGRVLALGLLPLLGGCAALAEANCRSQAERAGIYLGREFLGQTCSTSGGYSRNGRYYSGVTSCTPNYRDHWQWTPHSDYVYQVCMANYQASQGRPPVQQPFVPPPNAPTYVPPGYAPPGGQGYAPPPEGKPQPK